jgi:hypothetical protein
MNDYLATLGKLAILAAVVVAVTSATWHHSLPRMVGFWALFMSLSAVFLYFRTIRPASRK